MHIETSVLKVPVLTSLFNTNRNWDEQGRLYHNRQIIYIYIYTAAAVPATTIIAITITTTTGAATTTTTTATATTTTVGSGGDATDVFFPWAAVHMVNEHDGHTQHMEPHPSLPCHHFVHVSLPCQWWAVTVQYLFIAAV